MKPTNQQNLILDYKESAVVIAAPGSGKTFVISKKIKENLNYLLDHQGVIAISYTNKASNELKVRSLSNGVNPKSSFFGTIDKFNLSEIIIPFAKHLFGKPSQDISIVKIKSQFPDGTENPFEWFDRGVTINQISSEQFGLLINAFLEGVIFIETIGLLANYIFTNSKACQKYIASRYTHIYIDEYQDSGHEQHDLFLKIHSLGIHAIAVGDINQSIYAFSGKDSKFLSELTNNEGFKYFKLDKNHRCHSSIINYSNYLLNSKTELIPVDHNHIWLYRISGHEDCIAKWIDKNINKIQKIFEIKNRNQIGILTRVKRTGDLISANLSTPHKLYLSNELDNNLNIWSGIFSNLLHYLFDKSYKFVDAIESFTTFDKLSTSNIKRLMNLKNRIDEIVKIEPIDTETLVLSFKKIALLIAPNSENIESMSLLSDVFEQPLSLKSYEPANEDQLNILTLHKSKGLEYDIVIHLDLHEWVFPSKGPGPGNDFRNPIFGDWQQDLNLHYVGVTRAKKACFLITSTERTNNNNQIKNAKNSEFIDLEGLGDLRFKPKQKF